MKKLLQPLLLCLFVLLVACSQDKTDVLQSEKESVQPVSVHLDIEAEVEDESLRSSLRNLYITYAPNTIQPTLDLKEGDKVPMDLVFSNGTRTSTSTHTVSFTVNAKKQLIYKGDIPVTGFDTKSKWYVTAIHAGVKNGDAYGYAPAFYRIGPLGATQVVHKDVQNNRNPIHIPYMSGWTLVQSSLNKNKQAQGRFALKIRPMGYLLRLRIRNERDHRLVLRAIMPKDREDSFFFDANFTPTISKAAFESGAYPAVSRYGNPSQFRTIAFGQEGQDNNGMPLDRGDRSPQELWGTLMLWVMPKDKITRDKQITLRISHFKKGAEWYFPFAVTLKAGDATGVGGLSGIKTLRIPNDHKIYRRPYTLDYIAKSNESSSYTWVNYPHKTNSQNMTVTDWENILPRYTGGASPRFSRNLNIINATEPRRNQFGRDVPVAIEGYRTTSTSNAVTMYAIRRVDGNRRAAFRYTYKSDGSMTIEMVHADFVDQAVPKQTMDEISQASFWTEAYEYGEVIKREFPGQGRNTYYMGVTNGSLSATEFRWSDGGIYMNQNTSSQTHLVRFKKSEMQLVDAR